MSDVLSCCGQGRARESARALVGVKKGSCVCGVREPTLVSCLLSMAGSLHSVAPRVHGKGWGRLIHIMNVGSPAREPPRERGSAARDAPDRVRGVWGVCMSWGVWVSAVCSRGYASTVCARCTGVASAFRERAVCSSVESGLGFQRAGRGRVAFVSASSQAAGRRGGIVPPVNSTYKRFLAVRRHHQLHNLLL